MSVAERALQFAAGGDMLMGVLSPGQHASEIGLLIVVGGPQYRAGSHRQFVTLARHVAGAGIPALRFDVRGMGDSDGKQRSFEALDDDISAALAVFEQHTGVRRIVLFGLCDGASAALLHVARAGDPRVAGLVLLNPWVRSANSLARTHVKHYYGKRLLQGAFWRKLLAGGVRWSAFSGLARNLGRTLRPNEAATKNFRDAMADGWAAVQGPILLLLSEADLTAKEFVEFSSASHSWQEAMRIRSPHRVVLPGADHTCSEPAASELCERAILTWLQQHFHHRSNSISAVEE